MRSTVVRRWMRLLGIVALTIGASTCADGTSPTDLSRDVTANLSLSTEFATATSRASLATFDQLRVRAVELETAEVLGSTQVSVSSTDTEWEVALQIEMPPERESVQVYVEVELLDGGVVAWSGRTGPLDVSSGIESEPTAVEVYPGPLDNLSVLSVSIGTGSALRLLVGDTLSLPVGYELSDPAVEPVVIWSSSDPSIASVDQSGSVTGVAVGQTQVIAAAGPAADTVAVEVLAAASNVEWVGGTTGAETNWSEPGNWNPESVPTASSAVLIPASAQFMPTLSTTTTVGDLTMESGSQLDMSGWSLTVSGNLQAASVIDSQGGGELFLTGSGVTVQGSIGNVDARLLRLVIDTGSDVTVVGTSDVYADVDILGRLEVGNASMTAHQTLSTTGSEGVLAMQSAPATLRIVGDAAFDGGSTLGQLTAGTLELEGSLFVQANNVVDALHAGGEHRTVFLNATPQVVSVDQAATGSALQDVEVANTDVLQVQGSPIVLGSVLVGAGSSVTVAGGANLGVIGSIDQRGTVTLADNATTTASSHIENGGIINVGSGAQLATTGTLEFQSGSSLTYSGNVSAYVCLDEGGASTQQTGGVLDCLMTVAFPSHAWTGAVSSDWSDPANWESTSSPGTVPAIEDHAFVPSGTPNAPVISVTPQSGISQLDVSPLTGLQIEANQVLRVSAGGIQGGLAGAGGITGAGTIQLAGGPLAGTVPNLEVDGNVTLSNSVFALGNVTVLPGQSLDLNSQLFLAEADFTVANSTATTDHLVLSTANDVLQVRGAFTVGAQTNLSGGDIQLLGDFIQQNVPTAVSPTGTDFFLMGSTQQNVTFATPGTGGNGSHFRDLILGSGADILMGSEIHLTGALTSFDATTTIRNPDTAIGRDVIAAGLSVNGLTSDGVHIVLDTTDPAAPVVFSNVVYQGFPTTDTHIQLSIRHPAGSYALSGVEFAPLAVDNQTGNYLEAVDTDTLDQSTLTLTLDTEPGDGSTTKLGRDGTIASGATVNWP